MNARGVLRLISLLMLIIAVIFVGIAMSCPTCGSVIYIGSFRFGAEQWRICYAIYAIVMVLLFILSFFCKKKPK